MRLGTLLPLAFLSKATLLIFTLKRVINQVLLWQRNIYRRISCMVKRIENE